MRFKLCISFVETYHYCCREDFGHYVLFMAAANIQKIFRGRHAREAVAKLKAKSKKGKKGKKGKK